MLIHQVRGISAAVAICCGLLASPAVQAQVWTPMGQAGERVHEVTSAAVFAIPRSIAARGGVLRTLLVAGGQGGHAAGGSCLTHSIQGGQGGDGGEVFEVDIPIQPGQCPDGLAVQIGAAGRGAWRLGNGAAGEPGGDTQVLCSGVVIARALGGGRRIDVGTAARSAKGGAGGAIVNGADSAGTTTFDQRVFATQPAQAGQTGYLGYGSGGGGGGASLATTGVSVQSDNTSRKLSVTRVAPRGRGANGAGNGAGPEDFQSAGGGQAENASMYGAGGGGGAQMCASNGSMRDGGHGYPGLVRFKWRE